MAVCISRQIKIEGVLGTYATSVWHLNRIKLEFVLFFNSSKTLWASQKSVATKTFCVLCSTMMFFFLWIIEGLNVSFGLFFVCCSLPRVVATANHLPPSISIPYILFLSHQLTSLHPWMSSSIPPACHFQLPSPDALMIPPLYTSKTSQLDVFLPNIQNIHCPPDVLIPDPDHPGHSLRGAQHF